MRGCLHVRGDEVVLVDADLQVGLHSCFVNGDIPLDGGLTESQYDMKLEVSQKRPLKRINVSFFHLFTHLHQLHVLLTAANSHFGLQELVKALDKKKIMKRLLDVRGYSQFISLSFKMCQNFDINVTFWPKMYFRPVTSCFLVLPNTRKPLKYDTPS